MPLSESAAAAAKRPRRKGGAEPPQRPAAAPRACARKRGVNDTGLRGAALGEARETGVAGSCSSVGMRGRPTARGPNHDTTPAALAAGAGRLAGGGAAKQHGPDRVHQAPRAEGGWQSSGRRRELSSDQSSQKKVAVHTGNTAVSSFISSCTAGGRFPLIAHLSPASLSFSLQLQTVISSTNSLPSSTCLAPSLPACLFHGY